MASGYNKQRIVRKGVMKSGPIFARLIGTMLLFGAAGSFIIGLNLIFGQGLAVMAGDQFKNDNDAYWNVYGTIRAWNGVQFMIAAITLYILVAIWWKYIRATLIAVFGIVCLGMFLFSPSPAWAYYDKVKWPEITIIKPNQAAFWVPNGGDNLKGQAASNSEEFFKANKVFYKQFETPLIQLPSSSWYKDFWVPSGRLIIVSLQPFNATWTSSATTGTSSKDQSFTCQTKDGITLSANITIGAYVKEEDAPRFLHWFSVNDPEGDSTDPKVIFTSVWYAKNLKTVMDSQIWGAVSKFFCHEVQSRTTDEANAQSADIVTAAEEATRKYIAEKGITLDYLGLAGDFTFKSKEVQDAIDQAFEAKKIEPVLDVLKWQALFKVAEKWDGKVPPLPYFAVISPDITKLFSTGIALPAQNK